ncbi:MAG: peptidoglycan DD-metalloendopeptidase family protein, partial [Deltaproteobacteria bacterium]|nr:peptidoglycan DD-metalloendopeptidase family protein [Deltaproteobacteria bacterium]
EDLEKNLNRVETLLVERLVAFYKNAKRGYIRVLLSTEDMDLLNHNLKYLRVIMDRDRAVMDELARQKADYHREMSIIQEQLDAVTRLEESETKNLGELKDILEKEVLLLAKIHREKEFYEVAVKELQSAADDLKDTITNLESSAKKGDVPLPAGFGKSKGKLPMPLKGKIIKNAKKKGKSSSGKQKGIYIDGPSGMEVKAVYQGRVEYSGVLKGYGQVVVINHGERYYTISAYLDGRKKYEGDTVLAGDVIGYVGEAGLTTGPALYFEIRKGDEDLNPVKWIKVN